MYNLKSHQEKYEAKNSGCKRSDKSEPSKNTGNQTSMNKKMKEMVCASRASVASFGTSFKNHYCIPAHNNKNFLAGLTGNDKNISATKKVKYSWEYSMCLLLFLCISQWFNAFLPLFVRMYTPCLLLQFSAISSPWHSWIRKPWILCSLNNFCTFLLWHDLTFLSPIAHPMIYALHQGCPTF